MKFCEKNPDHILDTKTLNVQMSNFNVFFQMVLLYYGITAVFCLFGENGKSHKLNIS